MKTINFWGARRYIISALLGTIFGTYFYFSMRHPVFESDKLIRWILWLGLPLIFGIFSWMRSNNPGIDQQGHRIYSQLMLLLYVAGFFVVGAILFLLINNI